jgi:cytoskeleton protein RodZ
LTELTGIGAELRRAREAQGLTIEDVAQQLKFAPRQIESLESERFDRLPGPTIARGMVRNYARLLNIAPEPLLERMSPKVEPSPDAGALAARMQKSVPFSDSGRRSTLVYAGFSIAVLVLVAVVAYEWQQERAAPQFVAPAQAPIAPEVPMSVPEQTAASAPQVVSEPPPAPPPVQEPVAPEKPKPSAQPTPSAQPKPSPQQKPKPAAVAVATPEIVGEAKPPAAVETPPATGEFHRLVIICEEESWLEVKDGNGRTLMAWLAPAGSERAVRGQGPFEVVIGNAQGVKLMVDGKPVDLKPHTRRDVARVTIK